MSPPARRRRIDAPTRKKLAVFLGHFGRTGSVAFAAEQAGLSRNTLYRRRRSDPDFARGWEDAIQRAVDGLHDEALKRAFHGPGRPIVRRSRRPRRIRGFDDGLLMKLLRLYYPQTYGRASLPD